MGTREDYSDLLYGGVYDTLGVEAKFRLLDGRRKTVTVIDDTGGIQTQEQGGVQRSTVRPQASVRATDLTTAGVTADDLDGAGVTINEQDWTVSTHVVKPTVYGEAGGEYILYLQKARA